MTTILIVGAGFSGAVLARELVDNNPDIYIDLIDERDHIGGNAYDYTNKHGIRIHKYGPHLFHTNNNTSFNHLINNNIYEAHIYIAGLYYIYTIIGQTMKIYKNITSSYSIWKATV